MNKLGKIIEYLFYLFVFLLPWQIRWIWHYGELGESVGGNISEYLSFSFYGTEILLLLILFLTIFYRWKVRNEEIKFLNVKIFNYYILLGVFFVLAIIGLFLAADSQIVFYYLIRLLEGFALLLFVINFHFSYKKLGWALVFAGLVQSVLAIIQFLTQKIWASKWLGIAEQIAANGGVSVVESESMRWLRAYGALPHPNVLAGFLAICLIILIVLLLLAQNKKEKILLWSFLPVILTGLFFTFSKSGFLALAVALIFMAVFIFLSRDRELQFVLGNLILVIMAVLSLLAYFYQDPLLTRLKGETRLEAKSYAERADYLGQARGLISQNWLTGVGLGNYTLTLYNQDELKQPAWAYQPVHNVFILIVAEVGILGFIIFVLVIIESLHKILAFKIDEYFNLLLILKNFQADQIYSFYQRKLYWFLGLSAIFLMLIVIMFFDHYFWTLYFGIMLWWLMFGLWLKQGSLVK